MFGWKAVVIIFLIFFFPFVSAESFLPLDLIKIVLPFFVISFIVFLMFGLPFLILLLVFLSLVFSYLGLWGTYHEFDLMSIPSFVRFREKSIKFVSFFHKTEVKYSDILGILEYKYVPYVYSQIFYRKKGTLHYAKLVNSSEILLHNVSSDKLFRLTGLEAYGAQASRTSSWMNGKKDFFASYFGTIEKPWKKPIYSTDINRGAILLDARYLIDGTLKRMQEDKRLSTDLPNKLPLEIKFPISFEVFKEGIRIRDLTGIAEFDFSIPKEKIERFIVKNSFYGPVAWIIHKSESAPERILLVLPWELQEKLKKENYIIEI
jgi:hypothetical protein